MINHNFKIIKGKSIADYLQQMIPQVVEIIKEAYLAHAASQTINPNSYFLKFPDKPSARIIALPAAMNYGDKVSGIKWISSYPDNVKSGFQRASAVIVLNDYETGYPIACLEGSVISAIRTACSAILAAEYMGFRKKTVKSLAFIGNGIISKNIYSTFIKDGWTIEKINLFDLDSHSAEKLKSHILDDFKGEVEIFDTYQDAIQSSDLVVLATTAATPYISDAVLFDHNPVVLNVSLRDISPEILLSANNIVDDIDHVLTAQTSPDLAFRQSNSKSFINGTIADLLQDKVQLDEHKPKILSPMGMGILDMALANYIHKNIDAVDSLILDDFFSDTSR